MSADSIQADAQISSDHFKTITLGEQLQYFFLPIGKLVIIICNGNPFLHIGDHHPGNGRAHRGTPNPALPV